MATYENDTLIRTRDKNGNANIHYPITLGDNVLVSDEIASLLSLSGNEDFHVNLAIKKLIDMLQSSSNSGGSNACDVVYDPSSSGLLADNVQNAIDTILLKMYAGEGLIVNATVLTDSGEPVEGATIDGLCNSIGETCVTNARGTVLGFTSSSTVSLTATGFYDLEDSTVEVSGDIREEISVTFTMVKRNFVSINTSQTKKFSAFCKRVDVTAVGGGGGGGAGDAHGYSGGWQNPGAGGAGGDVVVAENVSFKPLTPYSTIVGAGGAGGTSDNTGKIYYGGTGGTSSLLEVSSAGGAGGRAGSKSATSGNAPTTLGNNGNGGASKASGTAGTKSGYTSFTETGIFGGGGSGGVTTTTSIAGASPYGGAGGYIYYNDGYRSTAGSNGYGPGGGGGGGGAWKDNGDSSAAKGGAGYRGVVNIRMWFEEDLAS